MEGIVNPINTVSNVDRDFSQLYTALAKAQGAMQCAYTTSDNPFFKSKYADFAEIVRASRPALTAHGLSVIQRIIILADGSEALQTILGHSSGQYIDSIIKIKPPKSDVQSLGSYITYLKRYSYAALVGVCTEDDDGEASMTRYVQGSNTANDYVNGSVISHIQLESLRSMLSSLPDGTILEKNIVGFNKVTDLSEITTDQYPKVLEYIKKSIAR